MNSQNQSSEKQEWKELDPKKLPEMMKHWYSVKEKYPNYLIAYRMGDFYETFFEDAKKMSSLLGLTLTKRGQGPNRYPLAGIPHKATQHFKNLIKLGETVVIVDQLENPKIAQAEKRIVKRGVVQILSPGTIIDDNLLDAKSNNYLASVSLGKKGFGIAFIDLSCGDFFCTEFSGDNAQNDLLSIIARFETVECILPPKLRTNSEFVTELKETLPSLIIKEHSMYDFQYDNAYKSLIKQFGTKTLEGFGVEGLRNAICAAGALISFLNETQKTILPNITGIKRYMKEEIMFLDANSQKNLEILKNLRENTEFGTLFSILNKTITPMGSRLMKKIIVQPLLNKKMIEDRLDIVELFKDDALLRNDLREQLSEIGDMERIISRINYSRTANARDLVYLSKALKILPDIKHTLGGIDIKPLKDLINSIGDYFDVIQLIDTSIKNEPPTTITNGGIIKDGYDSRVDEMREILGNGKEWMLNFENQEKKKLGISAGFKVGFNRVLGYYIQITDHALKGVTIPDYYKQRQKLTTSTRFETEELKKMEIKILNADETIKDIEYELFSKVRKQVAVKTKEVQDDAQRISMLDILSSLGETAAKNNYCRPKIAEHNKIIIKQGRHPIVEQVNISEPFIPNDCYIDTKDDCFLIITGPNWSGKSTYLRQVALITIIAQIGSFVPAEEAEIGIVDRVFTRIGASDDLTRGQSTFMMEMTETAEILRYATPKSLIIIDELGRGTSTTDGKSIARAVVEHLYKNKIKTLFSTHFHELIQIPLPIKNYHFIIKEEGRKLIFLRKLTEGGTDKSYGIHVAEMAGVPVSIIDRSFELVETVYNDETLGGNSLLDESKHVKPVKSVKSVKPKKPLENLSKSPIVSDNRKKMVQTVLFEPKKKKETDSENVKK
ncbi:MAG: DNA mismatch repair protein MutS [Promethearchaeota archaeon]